ncbi:macrolide 2'-phosphotransferase [Virgibacillus sp. NKC19-16]|uniref:macrolide 2'-phosphotransferase n=1 Tax=Virgibacillus salidurans TaxID=2831673 RepID=UPI001F2180B9|nr:macrolide 2'-phosphotransferase [Virgibacillus sp. NKC19-16]UJL46776.1 macrolide 2'-phosphotransferase [Virgibacillus sp. NKC19-16]
MTLSEEEVIEKAKKHGLKLRQDSLKYNESGLDFQVVFAINIEGEHWVLRFPRRKDVIAKANKEKEILDFVEPRIPMQTPNWVVFSEELIAYRLLDGIPAGTIDPEAKAYVWEIDEKNVPELFHETLGSSMAALHQVSHEDAKQAGLSVQTPEEIRISMKERMKEVKTAFGVDEELWDRWQTWLANDSLWPKQTALIHGDLHAGHILINKNARVTGFIDWTETRVDDPSNDFVAHLAVFGEEALKKLIQAYENAGGYVWSSMFDHIVELQAANPVAIAEFAMISGLEEYREMAKQTLGVGK